MPSGNLNIDTILRFLCPTMDRRYADSRSILDYQSSLRLNYNEDSISIFLPHSEPPISCSYESDNLSCPSKDNVFWPDTYVEIVFIDCSCENIRNPYKISTTIVQSIKGKPEFIGQGITLYVHEGIVLYNQDFPIYQQCCDGKSTDDCYREIDETEFNFMSYILFKSSLTNYLNQIDTINGSSGSIELVDFLNPKTDSTFPEGKCFYLDCSDSPPSSYVFVDNQVFRDKVITVEDINNDPLNFVPDSDWLIDTFNLKDSFGIPYDISISNTREGISLYTRYLELESNFLIRDHYNCVNPFNPDCKNFLPKDRPEDCCCDAYIHVILRLPCLESVCSDLTPGYYIDLSVYDIELTSVRFYDPVLVDKFFLAGILSTLLAGLIPGLEVIYNPISGSIILSLSGVDLEANIFICPCPDNFYWNSEIKQCCPNYQS